MSVVLNGLRAGVSAAGWAIGFLAVLGGLLIVLITLWAMCVCVLAFIDRKKEGNDIDTDD